MAPLRLSVASCYVPTQGITDRIRELCAEAIAAFDAELDTVFPELQAAIHQHAQQMRAEAASKLRLAREIFRFARLGM